MEKMERTLAIVNSPLQAMFALSYIKEFGITGVDFAVPFYSLAFLKKNRGVLRYLNDESCNYKIFITKNTFAILRFYKSLNKYTRFIIGDYRSQDKRMLTLFYSEKKIEVIYVDDGNASLVVGNKQEEGFSIRTLISKILDYLLDKRIGKRLFYSAFIQEKAVLGIPVVRNELKHFRSDKKTQDNTVVIVGCFYSAFREFGKDYEIYLQNLNHYLRGKWPSIIIKYYPHRREDSMRRIVDICRQFDWLVCQSRINIETDMAQSPSFPCEIVGFGSSALFLLKIIWKDVTVTSVHFNETPEYLEIENKYRNVGINVINL